tara:strand:- start:445 stop:750 length:306 start_codon:yes stop_codon:yes gene_type:complete
MNPSNKWYVYYHNTIKESTIVMLISHLNFSWNNLLAEDVKILTMRVPPNTCIESLNLILGKEVPNLEIEKGIPLSVELFKAMRYNTQYSNAVIYNRFARPY